MSFVCRPLVVVTGNGKKFSQERKIHSSKEAKEKHRRGGWADKAWVGNKLNLKRSHDCSLTWFRSSCCCPKSSCVCESSQLIFNDTQNWQNGNVQAIILLLKKREKLFNLFSLLFLQQLTGAVTDFHLLLLVELNFSILCVYIAADCACLDSPPSHFHIYISTRP